MIRGTIVACSPLFGIAKDGEFRYYLSLLQCTDKDCLLLAMVVVTAEGSKRRLIVGEFIEFETYKTHGDWVQVKECDLNAVGLSPVSAGSMPGEIDEKLSLDSFLAEKKLNYRGMISCVPDYGNYPNILLDGIVGLIAPDSLRKYHGTLITFCNLRPSTLEAVNLIFCPLFSSIDTEKDVMFEWTHNLSVCDLRTWRCIREQIKGQLEGIVSSQYFRNDSLFEELGTKVVAALSGNNGGADFHVEFAAHANNGSCKFCIELLPKEWIVPNSKSGCKGAFIGHLSICPRTGRPLIRCHGFEPYLLYHSVERLRFGYLVIAYPAVLMIEGEHTLLVAKRISYIAPLAEKVQLHDLRGDHELFMVKYVHPPVLLNKNESLKTNVEAYRFGKFSNNGACGKLVMEHQKSVQFNLEAALATYLYLAPGAIFCKGPSDRFYKIELLLSANLQNKDIIAQCTGKGRLILSCSEVAHQYLRKSQELLDRTHYNDKIVSGEEGMNYVCLNGVVVIEKSYEIASVLGLPQPARCKLPLHVQGDKYLLVQLRASYRHVRLVLPPGIIYPISIVVGAKLNIRYLRTGRDGILIPVMKTVFDFLGLDDDVVDYPLRYLIELELNEYVMVSGKFLKLLSFTARCICCSIIKNQYCINHGKVNRDDVGLEICAIMSFTDGTMNVKAVINSLDILQLWIDLEKIKILAMEAEIDFQPLVSKSESKLFELLAQFYSNSFLIKDYSVAARTFGGKRATIQSGQISLFVISIKPIDCFSQSRKLLALNYHQLGLVR